LEQYIWIYCNYQQDNWRQLLLLVEFAYNNAPSATTGISPFFANKGYHLNITVHPECDLSSTRAKEFVVDLDELLQELRTQIAEAQKCYQGPADATKTPAPDFKVGDKVFVKAEHFGTTRPSKKLSEKNLSPFEIITHSPTPRSAPSSTSCVPCLPTQTQNSEHNSEQGSTSASPNRRR
jgi:hypothetical protein